MGFIKINLIGASSSGKSTLAEVLCHQLHEVVISLMGYEIYACELEDVSYHVVLSIFVRDVELFSNPIIDFILERQW